MADPSTYPWCQDLGGSWAYHEIISGPHADEAACNAACASPVAWYCVRNIMYMSMTCSGTPISNTIACENVDPNSYPCCTGAFPAIAKSIVSGPYADQATCQAACV